MTAAESFEERMAGLPPFGVLNAEDKALYRVWGQDVAALRARLALAEELLRDYAFHYPVPSEYGTDPRIADDARAYLAHRAGEGK